MPIIKKVKMNKREIKRDRILEFVYSIFDDIKHNWQKYTIILTALIVIILGINYFVNSQKEKGIKAGQEFYGATQIFLSGNYEDAIDAFNKIQKSYYGTSASRKADYYKGLSYFYMGDLDNVVKHLRKFIKSNSNNEILTANAYIDLSKAYIAKNQADSALIYLKIFEDKFSKSYLLPEAYLTMASVYEMTMDIANADKYYKNVIYRFPNTEYSKRAQLYRNMLSGAIEVLMQSKKRPMGNVE